MNFFLGYAYRTYEQIKTQVIDWLKINLPENTDYNSSNPLVRIIEVFAGITQQLHYYIDFYAKELFLATARKFQSQRYFAQNVSYRIKGATPATVELTFSRTITLASLTIPIGTQVETQSGLVYETIQALTLGIGIASGKVYATQRVAIQSVVFLSSGLASQRISLEPKIVDRQLEVSVLGEVWAFQETLAFSSATDKHYTTFIDANGNIEVIFGDNINGLIPILEAPIQINYYITEGILGNVSPLAINKITSLTGLQSDLTVSNVTQATGGADQEGTTDLPITIPLFIRTLERAVTTQDYIDVALQYPSVAKASVITSCGNPIELFIAPKSGGIASPSLLTEIGSWIDVRKVGKEVIMRSLGVVTLKLDLTAYTKSSAYQTTARASLLSNIINFFSVQNQEASGAVFFSELYEAMQLAIGIDKTVINSTQIICYARPLSTAPTLQGLITVKTTSADKAFWQLVISQVTPSVQYTLKRKLVGETVYTNVATAQPLTTPYNDTRIGMTLYNSTYTLNDTWEFVSYKHFEKVSDVLQLDEPSLVGCIETDITLNMIGGLV